MADYVAYYSRADVDRIVAEVYGAPFSLIQASGTTTFETAADVSSFLTQTFAKLRESGYGKSQLNHYEVCRVHGDLAVVETNYTRYLRDGSVMGSEGRAATYVLRRTAAGLRIVAVIPHTEASK